MKRIFSLAAAALALNLCTSAASGAALFAGTAGSGNLRTETRSLSGFDSIDLQCSADIDVIAGSGFSVTVTADDNILPLIDTEVRDHKLIIGSHGSYRSRHGEKLTIHLPSLKSLALSGSGDAVVSSVSGGDVAFAISGSGDLSATGKVSGLKADIEGSGDMKLDQLDADDVQVRIDGSGDARVAAKQSLEVEINGSGDVQYRGNPARLRQNVSGSGSVSRL